MDYLNSQEEIINGIKTAITTEVILKEKTFYIIIPIKQFWFSSLGHKELAKLGKMVPIEMIERIRLGLDDITQENMLDFLKWLDSNVPGSLALRPGYLPDVTINMDNNSMVFRNGIIKCVDSMSSYKMAERLDGFDIYELPVEEGEGVDI